MNFKQIAFTCGYAETGQVGTTIFQRRSNEEPLNTIEDALKDFATDLFFVWWDSEGSFYINEKECARCHQSINKIDSKRFLAFEAWVLTLATADTNHTDCENISWTPWLIWSQIAKIPLEETIQIIEKAESILPLFVELEQYEEGLGSEIVKAYNTWVNNKSKDSLEERKEDALKFHIKVFKNE